MSDIEQDATPEVYVEPPTEPGFYQYSGGRQNILFLLYSGDWYAINDNTSITHCEWGYIEQALGIWDLIKIESKEGHHVGTLDV